MQLSQQEQTALTNLKALLSEDLYTINEIIDINTDAYMKSFKLMAMEGYSDPKTADKMVYTQSHVTRILRCISKLSN